MYQVDESESTLFLKYFFTDFTCRNKISSEVAIPASVSGQYSWVRLVFMADPQDRITLALLYTVLFEANVYNCL